jgi:hypothetical protein
VSKSSGLGDNFYLAGYDLSGDVNSLGAISCPLEFDDLTGIDKLAHERKPLKRDGLLEWVSYFNDAADQAHEALSTLPTADEMATYARGTALGNAAFCIVGKQINYDLNRADNGALRLPVQVMANGFAAEWGVQLTAGKRTDTGATNGTGVDTTASADFGGQAYLQAFSFAGTDVTVKIQDSADNSAFADVTGLAFTQITGGAPLTERISIANTATIRRYVRAVTVTTGGFSSLVFSVVLNKNEIAGVSF